MLRYYWDIDLAEFDHDRRDVTGMMVFVDMFMGNHPRHCLKFQLFSGY